MLNFNNRYLLASIALVFLAACGSEPRSAGAQDLSGMFHRPKEEFIGRAQLPKRPLRSFSADDPARILVIGDSLAQGFGIFLDKRVKERKLAAVVANKGRTSTGLARDDFYNWPAEFAAMAPTYRPDIIVAHFGANDNQTIIRSSGRVSQGSEDWNTTYRDQIQRILDTAAQHQAMVYLIGPAPDRGGSLNRHLTRINPLFQAEAAEVQAIYFPLSPFAAGPSGEYVKVAAVNGKNTTIRSGDGSHFTGVGYYLVADKLLADMEGRMPDMFNPAPLELAGILQ